MTLGVISVYMVLAVARTSQAQRAEAESFRQAQRLYDDGSLVEAESKFSEIARAHPNNVTAEIYLGQTLFREGKYVAAIVPYEKARSLERGGVKLTQVQHRILTDQLAMSYGISGYLAQAKALLEQSVRHDPDYSLNYYNLACVAAEENDKATVLKDLALAFQHRTQLPPGEQMPNPMSDLSFRRYREDPEFRALITRLEN